MNKAQGAIDYLLIIGVVILIVTVVIIALSGVLNSATEDTSQQEYQDSYLHMKYEHIGFPVAIKPGEHDSFTLALQPKNNSLPEIFKDAPNGTTITINYDTTYTKTEGSWGTEGDEAKINKGDIIDVSVPASYSKPLELQIKGEYTRPQPRKITFDCDGTEEKTIDKNLIFEPKDRNAEIVFKDFFEHPVAGSKLNISKLLFSTYSCSAIKSCEGTPCTSLNKTQCDATRGACVWTGTENEGTCDNKWDYKCSDFIQIWGYDAENDICEKKGCQHGDKDILILKNDWFYTTDPTISMGDTISLTCALGQTVHAELEESTENSIEKIEQLTLEQNENSTYYLEKTFSLKNYTCYSFEKLFDVIKEQGILQSDYQVGLLCSRAKTFSLASFEKINNNTHNPRYMDELNQLIYSDTVCTVFINSPSSIEPIDLTCQN